MYLLARSGNDLLMLSWLVWKGTSAASPWLNELRRADFRSITHPGLETNSNSDQRSDSRVCFMLE
jgi:hypothetical protein